MRSSPLRRAAIAVGLAAAALAAACASASSMLESVPAGSSAKVLRYRVDEVGSGTVAIGERTLQEIQRTPGVKGAKRAGGRNAVLVLVDADLDPSYLVEALRPDYRVEFLGEEARKGP